MLRAWGIATARESLPTHVPCAQPVGQRRLRMKSGAGRFLVAVIHQVVIPGALVLGCVLMASLVKPTELSCEGAENPEHARSCPVCRSPYRFAQHSLTRYEMTEF